MNHAEAIESQASERYALEMLTAAEVDAFEEHYFDCVECAEDVRAGMSLMDGGRRLVAEPAAPVVAIDSHPRRRGLRNWIPAAAAAALLLATGGVWMRMQNVAPALVADTAFLKSTEVRGETEASKTLVLAEGELGQLELDPPAGYRNVQADIFSGGKRISTHSLSAKNELVQITLPDPDPGSYELVLSGDGETVKRVVIARYPFNVQRPAATK
ncbi:MAG TPA: hypothetical protein VNI54_13410 [Thermoanaerobaculia bacterium]|nr:hypothetical protein [Thermoanaerobaculia bacterium]